MKIINETMKMKIRKRNIGKNIEEIMLNLENEEISEEMAEMTFRK
jgi:hypothetical protein